VERPGKWSAPEPALALGRPDYDCDEDDDDDRTEDNDPIIYNLS